MAKSFWRQKVPIHNLFHPKYHFHTPNSGGAMVARKLSSKNETTFFADFLIFAAKTILLLKRGRFFHQFLVVLFDPKHNRIKWKNRIYLAF